MAVRDDFSAGEVLAAADLNDTFASKVDYALPTNAQTGTAYTFVAADAEKLTTASNGSAVTLTIPPQSSVTWGDDTILRVVNYGAGNVTIDGGSGVTVTNTATTLGQYEAAAAIRTGSDAWTLVPFAGGGDLTAAQLFQSFTSNGTATAPANVNTVNYLVVAGGDNGSNASGTSGGAGGAGGEVIQGSTTITGGTTITVTVGGAGADSSIAISGGSTITATGGGGASAGVDGTQPTSPFTLGYFGGGGGNGSNGSQFATGGGGTGGEGGGGAGGRAGNDGMPAFGQAPGKPGKANTGGGGGGGGGGYDDHPAGSGGAGGSGLVVLIFSKENS